MRVFHHRELAVSGTVVEKDGAIVAVDFAPLDDATPQAAGKNVSAAPVSNGSASADQFLFAILKDQEGGYRHCAVCPVEFWKQNRHMSDEVNGQMMDGLLPEGCDEEAEGFFCSPMKKAELRKALLARGFKEDPSFTSFIIDIW